MSSDTPVKLEACSLAEIIQRKIDRVHPTNRRPDLPMMVKLTFADLEALATLAASRPAQSALREALRPFAACADQISPDESDEEWAKFRLLIGDYRRAAAAFLTVAGERQ